MSNPNKPTIAFHDGGEDGIEFASVLNEASKNATERNDFERHLDKRTIRFNKELNEGQNSINSEIMENPTTWQKAKRMIGPLVTPIVFAIFAAYLTFNAEKGKNPSAEVAKAQEATRETTGSYEANTAPAPIKVDVNGPQGGKFKFIFPPKEEWGENHNGTDDSSAGEESDVDPVTNTTGE